MTDLNTHGYVLKNSKRHAGVLITRVPVSYLSWMVNSRHSEARYAQAELDRRGTVTPELDVSGHAIDRVSTSCLDIWRATRKDSNEGLHACLCRMSADALKTGKAKRGKIAHAGMLFAFERDGVWPILKTVMRDNDKEKSDG